MVEHLTSALKAVLENKDDLNAVISALESAAPTSRERKDAESGKTTARLSVWYSENGTSSLAVIDQY